MGVLTDHELIEKANQGVGGSTIDEVLHRSGFSKAELGQLLGIDPKTLDNYRKKAKTLDKLKSELLLKLFRLFTFGTEVFGNTKEFRAWLYQPAGEFAGSLPVALLSTVTGVNAVEQQLERIAQGYVV